MTRFKIAVLAGIAACAIGLTGSTADAQTPQASGQYGYSGPTPSPQYPGGVPCHEVAGCNVVVGCPATHPNVPAQINQQLERFTENPPTCQEANVQHLTLYTETAPAHRYVDIWRNHYIPVRVTVVPKTPQGVSSFDVRVNYREVHVLCDSQGNPLPASQAAAVLKELEKQLASNAPAGPATTPAAPTAAAPAASEAAPPAPSAPAAPASTPTAAGNQAPAAQPAATAAAPAEPQKQWVWLSQEGVYGFGYQRADGLWEIDPGSRRPTL
jgi:hypothetical protein